MPAILPAVISAAVPSLIGGIFGGRAAAPAAQAAESAAGSQANMINMIMQMAQQMAPAQQELAGGAMDMFRGMPMQDIMQMTMLQDLMPAMMPEVLRAQAEGRLWQQGERARGIRGRELERRGIGGPLAERILGSMSEEQLRGEHGLGRDVMAWEAGETMRRRERPFENMLRIFGLAQGATQVPGLPFGPAASLQQSMTQAAGQAAAPWQQFGTAIQQPLQQYLSSLPFFNRQPTQMSGGYSG